jgi:hypothetical protein
MLQKFQNIKKRNCKTWKKRIVIRKCTKHKKMGTKLETLNEIMKQDEFAHLMS